MQGQKPVYTKSAMTKEQFFYAYKELAHKNDRHLLLESGRSGALCMAGVDPLVTLQALEGDKLKLVWRDGTEEVREGEPLELLNKFAQSFEVDTIPTLPDFQGGLMGFISYDYVRRYEPISVDTIDDLETPDLYFYLFDRWAVLDAQTETVYFMTLPSRDLDAAKLESEWQAAASERIEGEELLCQEKRQEVSSKPPMILLYPSTWARNLNRWSVMYKVILLVVMLFK